jgi:hypothetical protein
LPWLAQVAEQQGKYLGEELNRRAAGRDSGPFVWRNVVISSLLGGGRAIVEAPGEDWKYAGAWAYQHWRSALFTQAVSPREQGAGPAGPAAGVCLRTRPEQVLIAGRAGGAGREIDRPTLAVIINAFS